MPRLRSHASIEAGLTYRLVIPVVGNAPGANGTHFKSDVTILNYNLDNNNKAIPRDIKVEFYPLNGSAGPATYHTLRLFTQQWNNFLADFFNPPKTGLGSIVITAVDPARRDDPAGMLDAIARIYTAQPSSANCLNPNGEVSQALDSVRYDDLDASAGAYATILGAKQNTFFRTNLGIINHSDTAQTFTVEVGPHSETGQSTFFTYEVTVPAKGMIHSPVQGGNHGNMDLYVFPKGTGFFFSAYASTTDNRTGDGWTFRGTY